MPVMAETAEARHMPEVVVAAAFSSTVLVLLRQAGRICGVRLEVVDTAPEVVRADTSKAVNRFVQVVGAVRTVSLSSNTANHLLWERAIRWHAITSKRLCTECWATARPRWRAARRAHLLATTDIR